MFDYGTAELNERQYGQTVPPEYPLANITSPNIALFRGKNDALADVSDVNHLVSRLTGIRFPGE